MAGGRKRVTAADVARSLGVSRATVGFVLNDTPGQTISEATRDRVLAEAKRLGYRPHTAARALASGQSRIVLLVLPDWPLDHSMRANLEETSAVLDEAGYSLVTMSPHREGRAAPLWESLDPDVVLAMTDLADEQYDAIVATGAPTIVPGRGVGVELARGLDHAEGPRLQVDHLLNSGRSRLAFAGPVDARLAGLAASRRELADQSLLEAAGHGLAAVADVDQDSIASTLAAWLAQGIDGVVAYNDDVAALVVGQAVRSGVDVPGALAVIGHDDTPLASLMVPSLTTVRVDVVGLGRYLAELALSRAMGSAAPESDPHLRTAVVRRESA